MKLFEYVIYERRIEPLNGNDALDVLDVKYQESGKKQSTGVKVS
jgi:hypothetical protein